MTALTDTPIESSEHADQLFIDEQSMSSDDTVFLDLPLPPVPHHAVHVHNVEAEACDTNQSSSFVVAAVARMYSRMDDFDSAPRQSPESCTLSGGSSASSRSSSCHGSRKILSHSDWSSSDEDTSFYHDRERLSQFRCSESLTSTDPTLCEGKNRKGEICKGNEEILNGTTHISINR